MGRRKGSKNKPKSSLSQNKETVKKKDIQNKMDILFDFGFTKKQISRLFMNQHFISLRSLDIFTDNVIRKAFDDDSNIVI